MRSIVVYAHKTRLVVNRFVGSRCQMVIKLLQNIEKPLNIIFKIVEAAYNKLLPFKVK